MLRKLKFYEEFGVDEYYLYDPDHNVLEGWRRDRRRSFSEIPKMDGWMSPALGIRFDTSGSELTIFGPDGRPFLSYPDLAERKRSIAEDRDRRHANVTRSERTRPDRQRTRPLGRPASGVGRRAVALTRRSGRAGACHFDFVRFSKR